MKYLAVALLAGLALLCSCIGQPSHESMAQPDAGLAAEDQFLRGGLPPVSALREVDATFTAELNGSDVYMADYAFPDGDYLDLISAGNAVSWAIWRFSPRMASVKSVDVVMTVPDGEKAYIGLAEYNRNMWHFGDPVTEGQTLSLSDVKHKSPLGGCCIAVVTMGGDTATVYELVLHTEADWQIVTVDERGQAQAGYYTSLIEVQDNPAICYGIYGAGSTQPGLNYIRAEDANGTNWGAPVSLVSGHTCRHISAALAGVGYPSVCWNEQVFSTSELRFAYATDPTGTSWSSSYMVDGMAHDGADIGLFTSLAVKDGNPSISYFNNDFNNLKYAKGDFSSHTWSTDYAANGAYCYTSLFFGVDGKPLITFIDDDTQSLMLVGRNAGDTGWNPPVPVDAAGYVCNTASAGLVGADPGIAYFDLDSGGLKYAHYDFQHSEWQRQVIAPVDAACDFASLAVINGKPAVSFHDMSGNRLMFMQALDADGSSWDSPEVVDSVGYAGNFASLAEINGKPAISYQEMSTGSLMFAIRMEP